jgi:hypothetical protein
MESACSLRSGRACARRSWQLCCAATLAYGSLSALRRSSRLMVLAEHAHDLAHAAVLLPEAGEGHAVFGLKLVVGSGLGRHLRTLRHGRCCTSDLNPPRDRPVFIPAFLEFYLDLYYTSKLPPFVKTRIVMREISLNNLNSKIPQKQNNLLFLKKYLRWFFHFYLLRAEEEEIQREKI